MVVCPQGVFVVTYPNPLAPRWCGDVWLSRAEMEFIRDVFIPRLETIVKAAARSTGVRVIRVGRALD